MKFPAANGDQWKLGTEAPKTGRLASQAPRMNQQLIANQHIQITTPHCGRDMMCATFGGDGTAVSVRELDVTLTWKPCPELASFGGNDMEFGART
jgi:hypothetical protein